MGNLWECWEGSKQAADRLLGLVQSFLMLLSALSRAFEAMDPSLPLHAVRFGVWTNRPTDGSAPCISRPLSIAELGSKGLRARVE